MSLFSQGFRDQGFRDQGFREQAFRDRGSHDRDVRDRAGRGREAGAFDAREIGRLTWLGLAVAVVGWALLLGEVAVADVVGNSAAGRFVRPPSPTFHADVVDIAKCLIASGFGLAILGGLQSGFGALNRFFAAVLTRSSRPAPATAPESIAPEAMADLEPDHAPSPKPARTIFKASRRSAPKAEHTSASAPEATIMDRDAPSLREQRPYRILSDGSVEVETILGTRRFATMHEARDFI